MAAATSLRDYQLALSERLQSAAAGIRVASKLGLQVRGEDWLVDLTEAGEVIPVPAMSPVPLSRPWFRGVANVRGNLYSVSDFGMLLGAEPALLTEHARLLLFADRFRVGAGLLVERAVGLRNADALKPSTDQSNPRWVRAQYIDTEGRRWKELDIPALIQDEAFLEVSL
jgi:twitching motility protein PilI